MKRPIESDGYRISPFDDRDEEDPEYTVDPVLSGAGTGFDPEDPAVRDPDPKEPMAPAWNHEDRDDDIEA